MTDELTAPKTDRYGSSSLPCPKKPSVPSSAKYLYHCKRRCKMPRRAFLLLPIHCLHLQLPGDRLKPQEGILLFCSKHSQLHECSQLPRSLDFLLCQTAVALFDQSGSEKKRKCMMRPKECILAENLQMSRNLLFMLAKMSLSQRGMKDEGSYYVIELNMVS